MFALLKMVKKNREWRTLLKMVEESVGLDCYNGKVGLHV